jgi:hypothetical protein
MAADYTVIIAVRQRFGDNPSGFDQQPGADYDEILLEPGAPFVGASKNFFFDCPHVDGTQFGGLQFNSMGVGQGDNKLQVNGRDVPGGISMGPSWHQLDPHMPLWDTHSLLIERNVLQEQGNLLHIASIKGTLPDGEIADQIDDFIIDNAVMWFKTQTGRRPPVPPQNQ